MRLLEIGQRAQEINAINGWRYFTTHDWREGCGPNIELLLAHMALVHSEVSEASEAIRTDDRSNFAEELADVIIRVASISYGLGIDLEKAVVEKLEHNKKRGYRHGGKKI